jgi:hypothetical protein
MPTRGAELKQIAERDAVPLFADLQKSVKTDLLTY